VGEYLKFVFFNDDQDIVESTEHTGYIPGMKIVFPNDGSVAIEGTPTSAGTYVMDITVYTQRTDGYNIVLTVTIQDKSSDGTPVVTKDPTDEAVVEGESAAFIAKADNVRQYVWQIGIADACIGGIAFAVSKWVSGIPFDIAHCVGNFIIALVLFKPLRELLEKLYRNMRR